MYYIMNTVRDVYLEPIHEHSTRRLLKTDFIF